MVSAACMEKSAGNSLSLFSPTGRRTKCPSDTSPTEFTCRPGTQHRPTIFGRKRVERIAGWGRRKTWSRIFAVYAMPPSGNSDLKACGKDRWLGPTENLEQNIRRLRDATLWQFRAAARKSLVEYARERLSGQLAATGASTGAIDEAKHLFDPNALTLGFARRFATYKRPNLLLHDPERLLRLLSNSQRPVQLIIAGKAHPADRAGRALIQEWIRFIRTPEARSHVIFLTDYDMHVTEQLVQGVDVWINTPRPPWEACGTSGMKILVNGGLNLSELDGWWAEGLHAGGGL